MSWMGDKQVEAESWTYCLRGLSRFGEVNVHPKLILPKPSVCSLGERPDSGLLFNEQISTAKDEYYQLQLVSQLWP